MVKGVFEIANLISLVLGVTRSFNLLSFARALTLYISQTEIHQNQHNQNMTYTLSNPKTL